MIRPGGGLARHQLQQFFGPMAPVGEQMAAQRKALAKHFPVQGGRSQNGPNVVEGFVMKSQSLRTGRFFAMVKNLIQISLSRL